MRNIELLAPAARQVDAAGLRELDADELARYVADPAHPWWRREPCVRALAGRVPEGRVAELIARVQDPDDTSEVRIALLDLLGTRAELLPWLRHEDRRGDDGFGMREAFLAARGRLGDRSALPELATLAASEWPRQQAVGKAGLYALARRYGNEAILADLGDERPEDRAARLGLQDEELNVFALADPDRSVAFLAQSLLTDEHRLRAYLNEAPTTEAKLWAAYALYHLTEDAAEARAMYDHLGRPRVEVAGLDEELRGVIVHEYAGGCEERSDPRWRIEVLCTEPPARPDQDEQLGRAMAALTAAGFEPASPVSAGNHHQQGEGTYHVIACRGNLVHISTLGRFATGYDADPTARQALEAAGFRWIDDETGAIKVTDLCVYYFGGRVPLTVDTLLFYWQD
ncbi:MULTISPECIES: hypothetical protein [unclassified Streptomyces]|uniref:hypothetical protein n=1 Tax=unclassified Streptomyces TaxID=2593676 RepID=UPI00037B2CBC|nr:hypothetical protein [Streptomyces sp. BoleA5]MYX32797.1 hypothetical protein [Streptomyces sp. SID8377]